jgi:hypothetical protein
MKIRTTLTILLLAFFVNSYAQRLDCNTISKYSVSQIYQAFFKKQYSVSEAKCFGEKIATLDKKKGIKRVLTLYGPFTTGCFKCIYSKFGFTTIELGPNDILSDDIIQFIDSYNGVMTSILKKEQKREIDRITAKSNLIFKSFQTTQNEYEVVQINNSIVNFKMTSDILEKIFKSDMKHLKIEIGESENSTNKKVLKYLDLKYNGINIPINNELTKKLFICFDFSEMPDRYDLCWCALLEHKYRMILPINIK